MTAPAHYFISRGGTVTPWHANPTELEHIVAKHLPSPDAQSKPGWFRRWTTGPAEPEPASDWQPPYGSPGWPAEPPREVADEEWLTDEEVRTRFDPHGVVSKYRAEGNIPAAQYGGTTMLDELNRNIYQQVVDVREEGLIDGLTLAIQHLEVRANATGDNMERNTINADIACLANILERALEKRAGSQ